MQPEKGKCKVFPFSGLNLFSQLKYTRMEHVSTSVVISGEAIIAGSRCNFFAASGSIQPISLDKMTVTASDSPITRARLVFLYIIRIRMPFAAARTTPTIRETLNSLNMTLNMSPKCISSRAIPRIIKVELWDPQFPPVSISMGMKETRRGTAEKASS